MGLARSVRQYLGVRALLPPDLQTATRAPTSNDKAYVKGTLWLDTVDLTAFMWSGTSWIALGTGATGGVVTINSLSPVGGNIIIAGTANQIAIANAGHTVTLSVPATFIAPGSIAATTTVTAGTGITATTGDIVASTGNITSTLGSVGAATTVTAGTSITATLGNITATNGDVVLGTAGNKLRSTSVASTTTAGANSFGKVSLVGGAAIVATSAAHTASIIFLTVQALGTVTVATPVAVTARSDGVSFTITSSDATDTSSIGWMIVN